MRKVSTPEAKASTWRGESKTAPDSNRFASAIDAHEKPTRSANNAKTGMPVLGSAHS